MIEWLRQLSNNWRRTNLPPGTPMFGDKPEDRTRILILFTVMVVFVFVVAILAA